MGEAHREQPEQNQEGRGQTLQRLLHLAREDGRRFYDEIRKLKRSRNEGDLARLPGAQAEYQAAMKAQEILLRVEKSRKAESVTDTGTKHIDPRLHGDVHIAVIVDLDAVRLS